VSGADRRPRWVARAAALTLVGTTGCFATLRAPDLGGIYNRAARDEGPTRNPVIVIPGILGSRLRDPASGTVVWGAFGGNSANPNTAAGARLLALPMHEGAALAELRDDVEADRVLDRVHVSLLRLPLEQQAYVYLLGALGAGGYRDETLAQAGAIDYGDAHFTCFQFPYDWRRDNVENARRLDAFIREKRAYVQAELARRYGRRDADVHFDIVAHSMGGLLTRYYLLYGAADLPADGTPPAVTWAGARLVDRAILVGTPNGGSVSALLNLVRGADFSWLLPRFEPALLGTMPGVYQLLPRTRHGRVVDAAAPATALDVFDPALWERLQWGLASPAQDRVLRMLLPEVASGDERRRIALDHLRKSLARARQFTAAVDARATTPPGLSLELIAGDAEPTDAVVAADASTGALKVVARAPGDGTVLRSSALLDERAGGSWSPGLVSPIDWTRVNFLFTDHLGLTRDPGFTDNLLFLLLEAPRRHAGGD
jgi:hypothetical protein